MAQYDKETEQRLKDIEKILADNFKSFTGKIECISLYEF